MKFGKKLLSVVMIVVMLAAFGGVAASAAETPEIKNIIYMIGDGMGPNHLAAYKHYNNIEQLNMEKFPVAGYQVTRSFGKILTDSAAGGTALACGIHTWVNAVGVYPDDPFALLRYPMNLRELAAEQGMKTGIVVTKKSDDATPAAFSSHTYSRGNSETINEQQLSSGIDVLMGAETGYISNAQATEKGYAYATDRTGMNTVASGKLIGQFDGGQLKNGLGKENAPSLKEMSEKAIKLLENDKGFFLMIEGSTIDSYSHSNEMEGMLDAFEGFENTIEYVLNYAKARTDTMVVITADHETGGIKYDEAKKEYYFTSGGHTNTNVPYFAYVPDGTKTPFKDGVQLLNKDIPQYIAQTCGWGDDLFPRQTMTKAGDVLEVPIKAVAAVTGAVSTALGFVASILPDFLTKGIETVWIGFVDGIAAIVNLF